MADFCNLCTTEMFGEGKVPDIDVYAIFKALEPNYMSHYFMCEGCGMHHVHKTLEGKMILLYRDMVEKTQEQYESSY